MIGKGFAAFVEPAGSAEEPVAVAIEILYGMKIHP
jgi:hypothetical protein